MMTSEAVQSILAMRGKRSKWPWILVVGLLLTGLFGPAFAPLATITMIGTFVLAFIVRRRERARRVIEINYPDGSYDREAWSRFLGGFERVAHSQAVYEVKSTTSVGANERKYQAGASSLITRTKISASLSLPPNVRSNIAVPSFPAKPGIYFFPDHVLLDDKKTLRLIPYGQLSSSSSTTRFIESGFFYPKDAPVVDHTWRYVNKNGSPDKRMKDNKQLPVLQYDELELSDPQGYVEVFQISAEGAGREFSTTLADYSNEVVRSIDNVPKHLESGIVQPKLR